MISASVSQLCCSCGSVCHEQVAWQCWAALQLACPLASSHAYFYSHIWDVMLVWRKSNVNRTVSVLQYCVPSSSSSRMCVMNHNWSATKQRLHSQSVAEISRHSVLSGDRIWQCGTSSGSCHRDTDQCLQVAISFYRHCSVPVSCENGSVETIVTERG